MRRPGIARIGRRFGPDESVSRALAPDVQYPDAMHESTHTDRRPSWIERCTYAAYLGSGLLALALAMLSFGSGQFVFLLHATLALVAALLFRARLIIGRQLAACAEEDDAPAARFHSLATGRQNETATLAARSRELESLRGTPRFDPWEALLLRRKLAAQRERS